MLQLKKELSFKAIAKGNCTLSRLCLLMISLSVLMLTACDNNNPNNPGDDNRTRITLGSPHIKAATIVYSTTNMPDFTGDIKISFDIYGSIFRCEMRETIYILDHGHFYELMPETKTYREYPRHSKADTLLLLAFMYSYGGSNYFNFKNETAQNIAGIWCVVYSWIDNTSDIIWGNVTCGVWNNIILMWSMTTINGTTKKYEMKSLTESANPNDFIVPADYTKITYED